MTNKNSFRRGIFVSAFLAFLAFVVLPAFLAFPASGCATPARQPALRKSAKASIISRTEVGDAQNKKLRLDYEYLVEGEAAPRQSFALVETNDVLTIYNQGSKTANVCYEVERPEKSQPVHPTSDCP